MPGKASNIAVVSLLGFCVFGTGCQTAHVEKPLTGITGASDEDAQSEFWDELSDSPVACNDDFCHAVLLYLDQKDAAADYAGRVKELKSRGILGAGFDRPGNEAVDRGTVAVAMVKILNIHGGLMMTLLGDQPRYAVRELVYLNLYPQSSPEQEFSGMELVGIVSKMEEYQRGDVTDLPATVMPAPVTRGGGAK